MASRSLYLKAGYPVRATSLTGQKIIGNFVRNLASFGCVVHGVAEGSLEKPTEHKCSRISVERIFPEPEAKKIGRPTDMPVSVKIGEACQGLNVSGQIIRGAYAGLGPKPYAYIRTFTREGVFTHKVSRESIKKTLD